MIGLFLMVSRFMLTLQYLMILFQIRKHKEGRAPLMIAAGAHLLFAVLVKPLRLNKQ